MALELVSRFVLAVVVVGMLALALVMSKLVTARWWPTVLFQWMQRQRLVTRWCLVTAAPVLIFGSLVQGAPGLEAAFILWLIVGPVMIAGRVDSAAWSEDAGGDLHGRAVDVRNRLRQRTGEAAIAATKPWRGYVIDAARAERIRSYQEQFEG